MKFEEVLEHINTIKYSSLWDADEYLEYDLEVMACDEGLDVDKHRWYESSTNVYPIGNRFLGVRGVSHCYSEMSDASDYMCTTEAFEMEEIKTVMYIKKKETKIAD